MFLPTVIILVGAIFFTGGLFAYTVLFSNTATGDTHTNEKVGLSGYAVIKFYDANGELYKTWERHNDLTAGAKNAIAACGSGLDTTPGIGSFPCSSWVTLIELVSAFRLREPAVNSLIPAFCNADSLVTSEQCNGWISEATFDFQESGNFDRINTYPGPSAPRVFDTFLVNPPLDVNAGDRLIVTITFTVS